MAKSNEPFWWALFGAGGMVAALLMPITIIVTGFLAGTGLVSDEGLWDLLKHPVTQVYLFVLISLSLFHFAHRFRFTLVDLGLKSGRTLIAVLCYGSAIVGTALAAFFIVRLWL